MSAVDCSQSDSAIPARSGQTEPIDRLRRTPLELAACIYNRVLIVLVLYVLSIGPSFWLWMDSMSLDGPPAVAIFYYPLLWLCDWFPPFGDLVNWYIRMWWF
jgi:hypothetical protein